MHENIFKVLNALTKPKVLVVGDFMLDRYVWGSAERISPEAPIPVLRADLNRLEERPGGAGSVAADIAALDAKPVCIGIIGNDPEGKKLVALLKERGAATNGIFVDKTRPTTLKMRLLARSQQMLRVDREKVEPLSAALNEKLAAACRKAIQQCSAVVVQDHGKGTVGAALMKEIVSAARKKGIPVLADPAPRADFKKYLGVSLMTPNRSEARDATGITITDASSADRAARKLIDTLGLEGVVITLDREGMAVAEKGANTRFISSQAREVFDVTGAGDVVAATLAVSLASDNPLFESAQLANIAAGIEVGKIGVATVTRREIRESLGGGFESKIKSREDLQTICEDLHARGEKVVFTNGCFDLLHIGHVSLLAQAKKLGDALVVAINSDVSARRVKGPGRPIIDESARAGMLAALECVDYVIIYGEDTPIPILKLIRPDVIVKGGEYGKEGVVGGKLVEKMGGRIENIPMVAGFSTTKIAERAGKNSKKKETGGRGYVRT